VTFDIPYTEKSKQLFEGAGAQKGLEYLVNIPGKSV